MSEKISGKPYEYKPFKKSPALKGELKEWKQLSRSEWNDVSKAIGMAAIALGQLFNLADSAISRGTGKDIKGHAVTAYSDTAERVSKYFKAEKNQDTDGWERIRLTGSASNDDGDDKGHDEVDGKPTKFQFEYAARKTRYEIIPSPEKIDTIAQKSTPSEKFDPFKDSGN